MRRSAIVLKALIYQPTGALVAAPTTSLPESIGGDLNWDFRFAWLRDSGLVVDVLQRLGYHEESMAFLDWIERLPMRSGDRLQPVYRVDGSPDLREEVLPQLAGYRNSRPVRIGNAASEEFQLDVFRHVAEAACRCYLRMPRPMKPGLWEALQDFGASVMRHWREPDSGIWENRGKPRHYLHSKAYCWLALESLLRLAERFGLTGDTHSWRRVRDEIRETILDQGYDPEARSFRQALGETGCDATALVLPLIGLLPADDPRVQDSIARIRAELSVGELISRRRKPELEQPDEGAFLLCNFWLVDVLVSCGRRAEAEALFRKILPYGNDVGLFPEEVDPATGDWLGAFPIGFTHLGLIRSAMNLADAPQ